VLLGKIAYDQVNKLRRCKNDPGKVRTDCEPLTNQHIDLVKDVMKNITQAS